MFGINKSKCQRFFIYEKREINMSGLSASMPKESSSVTLSLGQFSIKPEYEKVTEKLQNLDILQFSLCQDAKNLEKGLIKQSIIERIINTKLEMMLIAQNPKKYEENLKTDIDYDKEIYNVFIQKFVELTEADNWYKWTSGIFRGGKPGCRKINIEKLKNLNSFILSCKFPTKYESVKKAFLNFKYVSEEFIFVFNEYAELIKY